MTRIPPTELNACVQPSTASRCFWSANSSASQAIAATNSTDTPIIVVQRKKSSISGLVENPAAKAEKPYSRMLQTSTRRRPSLSVSQPPSSPNIPPKTAGA